MQLLGRLLVVIVLMGIGPFYAQSLGNKAAGKGIAYPVQQTAEQALGQACEEQLAIQPGPVYRGNQGINPARALHTPDPKYPKGARKKKQGAVVACFIVDVEGRVSDVRVSRSLSPDLDDAAIDTVKSWTFVPATKDGKPVSSQVWATLWFKIRG